jgi:GTP-binding protein YchF
LAKIVDPERTVPAAVQFVDIAGLVKGASKGEGRGNAFLSNIRETDAIVHVVRCFDDPDVIHVDGSVNPARDRETIEFELALADLTVVEKRLDKAKRAAKTGDKVAATEAAALEKAFAPLADGKALWHVSLTDEERALLKGLQLLTMKPILYAANVTDAELTGAEGPHVTALRAAIAADHEPAEVVTFSAKIEAELAELPPADRAEFLGSLGIESAGLDRTIHKGDTGPKAAGVIHSDFERGFIRAETVGYDDFVKLGGWKGAREKGAVRSEGKEYVVQDGDVLLFRFNV